MKLRRYRLLLLFLFLAAMSGEALHTVSAHHDASHCSVCSFHSHSVGSDSHTETALGELYIPHETPQLHCGLSERLTFVTTLFGRAPPHLHS